MKFLLGKQIVVDYDWNSRKDYERIELLAANLKKEDPRVPFEVRPVGPPFEKEAIPDLYFMLSGHRRSKAFELIYGDKIGEQEFPVIVEHPRTEAEARVINIRENTGARQMRNVDLAREFFWLAQNGMTEEEISRDVMVPFFNVRKLRFAWQHAVPELRDYWLHDKVDSEATAGAMVLLAQRKPESQRKFVNHKLGISLEHGLKIVPKREVPFDRTSIKKVRAVLRLFREVQTREKRAFTPYEKGYLDALLWVNGEVERSYNPWKGK